MYCASQRKKILADKPDCTRGSRQVCRPKGWLFEDGAHTCSITFVIRLPTDENSRYRIAIGAVHSYVAFGRFKAVASAVDGAGAVVLISSISIACTVSNAQKNRNAQGFLKVCRPKTKKSAANN